jgi:uncharacterized membrane protein (UPF0136 family)
MTDLFAFSTLFALARLYLVVFGVLTIAGGALGFVRAKSRASLIAGSVSGLLLVLSGYLVGTGSRLGLILGFVVCFALTTRFGLAYRRTRKAMPALPMTVLGAAGVVLTTLALLRIT